MENKIRLDLYEQTEYSRGRNGIIVLLWWLIQGTVFRFSLHQMYGWRRWLLTRFGAEIGHGVKIRSSAKFTYPWKVTIGDHSWIGDNAEFYSLDEIAVGRHCVISQNTYLCTGSHRLNDPSFGLITKPIVIKDGAWVASDVFVYPGVIINEMAVAGARSTVIKNIPANEIHVGYPAVFIKRRFPQQIGSTIPFERLESEMMR
ncbi:WcaF family extracellular polysaccharide biosynthesis acetyltransferase [Paenibacillus taichungensis]|uniref:WcaF family extracellular polysaccharide biosynthesis acetyltransferase n=1 Tax=Paenibacillus TaxID=44249 RepID=UPI00096F2F56|nr:WcaF family extracellular polysaccharide biosynthesis acetyltransferase [Paenibacillus taichungensis]MEC0106655.1 WcaF family extracellular polysaccharide biosynthesis acetyltransferase [Paenibacillus taichungensis]MEC0198581.1 WcaF family extracellular polysaccharide biosynthesis acetyltransferase [Paenibacillus taichungensis]OME77825.1 colanic acid biosynthesis acetyltransferase WcaF [Paenibacillus pabuli]